MTKKMWFMVVLAIVLVLAASACTRAASTSPVATATTAGALPFPVPATDNTLRILQTQTAIAKGLPPAGTVIVLPTATTAGGGQQPQATQPPVATQAPAPTNTEAPAPAAGSFNPTPGIPSSYTLEKGEFPYCIARRFNLNPAELLSVNGLTINSRPGIGTKLKLPTTGNHWNADGRSLKKHPATYTVVSGDTIFSIACAYGDVDPNGIIAVNNLKSPYSLTSGQSLSIP